MAHSKFSASSAERWVNCPGSVVLTAGLPDTTSAAALAGTIGHAVADICLSKNMDANQVTVVTIDGVAHDVPDDTMMQVNAYVKFLKSRGGVILPEARINYSNVLGVPEDEGFGTSDATVLLPDNSIETWDLKLGHRYVGALDNKQITLYALGTMDAIETVSGDEVPTVTMGIFQPTLSEEPKSEVLTRDEIRERIVQFKDAATRVKLAEAHAVECGVDEVFYKSFVNPGESQCQWCKFKASCPALAKEVEHAMAAATTEDFTVVEAPGCIDDKDLKAAYDKLPLIELFIKAVEDEVYARAENGFGARLGVKFVAGRAGNRKWTDESAAATALVSVLGEESVYNKAIVTPAVAEKLLKKAKSTSVDLNTLTTRAAASKTLTSVNDPREEWSAGGADDFS